MVCSITYIYIADKNFEDEAQQYYVWWMNVPYDIVRPAMGLNSVIYKRLYKNI